jgi:hypothetical protein
MAKLKSGTRIYGTATVDGNLGVGTAPTTYPLTVVSSSTATTGLTNVIADFTANTNSYSQINTRNASNGASASSDIIATADTGTDTTNYIDLGINNSAYSVVGWTVNGALDGYLYTSDTNLSIGAASNKYVSIFTGGTLAANERLRVTGIGSVGIGTTNPTQTLHVQGNARITGGLYDSNNNVGAASSVLISTGAGVSWSAPSSGGATLNNSPSGTYYPTMSSAISGSFSTAFISSTALTFTTSTGALSATQFTSLSDETQKTNITRIANALDLVMQMNGVRYDWTDGHNTGSIGVIAQEMERIIPEVVSTNDRGLKTVSYGNLVGVLIEAIKEQQVRIEELERKLDA